MSRKHMKRHTHTHGIFAKFEILMQINIQKLLARIKIYINATIECFMRFK